MSGSCQNHPDEVNESLRSVGKVANPCLCLLIASFQRRFSTLAGMAAALLAGCAAQGPVDGPVARNLSWFSYLAGDDIRSACAPGAPERYRFVYNAVWGEQVRTYDMVQRPGGAAVTARVFGAANLLSLNPLDPQGPWRGQRSETLLDPAQFARVARLLPGEEAVRPGAWLRSDDYYWTATACKGGRFLFQAWDSDTPDFDGLPFLKVLLPLDRTGVAPRPWEGLTLAPFDASAASERRTPDGTLQLFRLQVGRDGLNVGRPWF
jgi:hypothetical protein